MIPLQVRSDVPILHHGIFAAVEGFIDGEVGHDHDVQVARMSFLASCTPRFVFCHSLTFNFNFSLDLYFHY